jgi:hypothetical protein
MRTNQGHLREVNWSFHLDNARLSASLADGSLVFLDDVQPADNNSVPAGIAINPPTFAIYFPPAYYLTHCATLAALVTGDYLYDIAALDFQHDRVLLNT